MDKSRRIWFHLLSVALAVNLVIGYTVYSQEEQAVDESEVLEKINVMMRVLHLIQQDYVDPGEVDYTSLIYNALHGMVSSLDPHSSFLEPSQFQQMVETTEGEFGGVGIVVTMKEGILTVVTPIEDTPAGRAGILAGDQILEIDGKSIKGSKLSEVVDLLKGEAGTEVTMQVYRPDTDETFSKTLKRAVIEVKSVKEAQFFEEGICYIRITQFDEQTAVSLEEALKGLPDEKMESLILDLRNNPGGLLKAAVDVCSLFIEDNKLVVFTEGRQPSQKQKHYTDNGRKWLDIPIVILVNRGSASAAEIVAGCLRDYGRAVLVGDTTFGKGSVQNVVQLPDGSALRLTTAMYYTPSKHVIHDKGIDPNIEVKLTKEQLRELLTAQARMGGQTLVPEDDPQLARAIEVLQSYSKFRELTRK